jgi:hypothetical protein
MTSAYDALLRHWATHGFVVIASNSTSTGSGTEMKNGITWAISENSRMASVLFGKLNAGEVGSVGHSMGGIGAVITGNDPRVSTTVPIAGGDPSIPTVRNPIFLVGGSADAIVNPQKFLAPQFAVAHAPIVYGVLQGATHTEVMPNGGRERGYLTAWLVAQLMGDASALAVFYGKDCTICKDSTWAVERKNIPGVEPPVAPTKDQCVAMATVPSNAAADCKDCLCGSCPLEAVNCDQTCWALAACIVNQCHSTDVSNFSCTGLGVGTCSAQATGLAATAAMGPNAANCLVPGKCLEKCVPSTAAGDAAAE